MKEDKTSNGAIDNFKRELQRLRDETDKECADSLVKSSNGSMNFEEALKIVRETRDIDEGRMNFKGKIVTTIEGHGDVEEILFNHNKKTFIINEVVVKGFESAPKIVVGLMKRLISSSQLSRVCTGCGTVDPATDNSGRCLRCLELAGNDVCYECGGVNPNRCGRCGKCHHGEKSGGSWCDDCEDDYRRNNDDDGDDD